MGKDSRDLPGQALLDAALFDPIEVMVRDRYGSGWPTVVQAILDTNRAYADSLISSSSDLAADP
jgi:hypothetical protein